MKKTIQIFLFSFFITIGFSQEDHNCDTVFLNNEENIKKSDPCVLIAADYILNQPLHGNDKQYFEYRKFILAWMDKTPDYTFSLNSKIMDLFKDEENVLLFGVYTTCQAKAAVKLKQNFAPEGIKLFVEYIVNQENKVKHTSKIKKLISDFNSNKIEKYISE